MEPADQSHLRQSRHRKVKVGTILRNSTFAALAAITMKTNPMRLINTVLLTILAGWLSSVHAAEIMPVNTKLSPAPDQQAVLTIHTKGSSTKLTLADIERLPMKQTTLQTKWGMNGTFQGVLLSDLMVTYHFDKEAKRIVFGTTDNYVAGLSRGEINGSPAFLATRLNGRPIPLNDKGPLILLWPGKAEAVLQGKALASSWVWSISSITAQ